MSFNYTYWQGQRLFKKSRATYYRNMATVMTDGGSFKEALRQVAKRTADKPIGLVYKEILQRAKERSFSSCHDGFVPASELQMISAFESTGSDKALVEGLRRVANTCEALNVIAQQMRMFVIQAIWSIALIAGMCAAIALGVIPPLSRMSSPDTWPFFARTVMFAAQAAVQTWYVSVPLLLGSISLFVWSLPRWTGPRRKLADNYFPYKPYRLYRSTTALIALATHLQANRGIGAAIDSLTARATPHEGMYLFEMRKRVTSETGAKILDVGFLPDNLVESLYMVTASRASVDVAIQQLAQTNQAELIENFKQQLTSASAVLNNVAKIIGVVLLAAVLFSMSAAIIQSIVGAGRSRVGA